MTARLAIKLTPRASADRIDGWDVDPDGRPVLKENSPYQHRQDEIGQLHRHFDRMTRGCPNGETCLG